MKLSRLFVAIVGLLMIAAVGFSNPVVIEKEDVKIELSKELGSAISETVALEFVYLSVDFSGDELLGSQDLGLPVSFFLSEPDFIRAVHATKETRFSRGSLAVLRPRGPPKIRLLR